MPLLQRFLIVFCLGFLLCVTADHTLWEKTTSLPYPVSDMSAVTLGHKIYLMGGCVKDQTYVEELKMSVCPEITSRSLAFVPETKKFEVLPPAPNARYRHAALALGTKIYVAGGRTVDDEIIKSIDVFDTVKGTWGASVNWSGARSDNAAFADGDNIVFVGGYNYNYSVTNANKRVQVLKTGAPSVWLQTDCWLVDKVKRDATCYAKSYGDLQVSRGDVAAVAGSDGKGYLVGGKDPVDFCPGLETVEVFDPKSKQWSIHPSKKHVGRADNALAFHNGHILVVGGERLCNDKLEILDDVEALDVTAPESQWVVGDKPLPVPTFRMAAAQSGDRVYVFGGQFAANEQKTNVISDNVFVYSDVAMEDGGLRAEAFHNLLCFVLGILFTVLV